MQCMAGMHAVGLPPASSDPPSNLRRSGSPVAGVPRTMAASRIANLHAHLLDPARTCSATLPAAVLASWGELEPVAVATRASHPGQTWGHAHPDIVKTAVRGPHDPFRSDFEAGVVYSISPPPSSRTPPGPLTTVSCWLPLQDGTLVIVHALQENDSPGNDVLVCTRSTNSGRTWSPSAPIDCTRFSERPVDAIPELDGTVRTVRALSLRCCCITGF